jgi:hypothetical protein
MPINYEKLAAPFPPDEIEWRVGSTTGDKSKGMALAYLDARAVMDRLDAVCTPGGWQDRYSHVGEKTCCEIGILSENGWIWKADGAGDTDFEGAKGAFSDAFKRAAVRWGIGRYLYDIKAPWVEIEQRGRSYVIKPAEMAKLNKLASVGGPVTTEPVRSNGQTFGGPLTKTELKNQMRAFAGDLAACEEYDQLVALLNTSRDLLSQCIRDLPDWYYGAGDSKGAQKSIEEAQTLLAPQADANRVMGAA